MSREGYLKLQEFEDRIRKEIKIPDELRNNLVLGTTSLGGVFLQFASDTRNNLTVLNSAYTFKIFFTVNAKFNIYVDDTTGLDVIISNKLKGVVGFKNLRGMTIRKDYRVVTKKVNDWMNTNRKVLYSVIENK
ncbi:hypothetical protein D3C81_09890 [compost metagenome]